MTPSHRPLRVVWISFFPVEWLPDTPQAIARLPRLHPATWQRVLVDELKHCPDLELHIVSLRKELAQDVTFTREGVTFHCLRVPGGWCRAASLFWLDTWRIRRILRDIRPDLVHAWGTEQAAAMVASRLDCPYLVTIQGILNWIAERVSLNRFDRLAARLEQISLRRARWVSTEASFSVRYLREHYPHLQVFQIEHAANWLFHRLDRRPATAPMQLLFVGMLSYQKGVDLLMHGLDRLRRLQDFRLTLVGSGSEYLDQLKRTTSPELWQRTRVREQLQPSEVADEMARATLMIFPSRVDTSPNSVKEAAVSGLPVVASAVGGVVDYIVHGKNGITFEPGNQAAMEQSILEAWRHPLFSQGEVEASALTRTRELLSPRLMAEKFHAAYRRVRESWNPKAPEQKF